jgi:prevent-host-death family protein
MTTYDYVMTMTTVRIAELKSRLSSYLQQVRRGHPVIVLDRDTPVARIVPFEGDSSNLTVRTPRAGRHLLRAVRLPPPLPIRGDILALLREERQSER